MVCEAIVEKGFNVANDTRNTWFYEAENNWKSVCNSRLAYGAMALFEEVPEMSEDIIEKCMEINPKAMASYTSYGVIPKNLGIGDMGQIFR